MLHVGFPAGSYSFIFFVDREQILKSQIYYQQADLWLFPLGPTLGCFQPKHVPRCKRI